MKREFTLIVIVALAAIVFMTNKAKAYAGAVAEEMRLFGSIIEAQARKYGVPFERIAAIILVESMNNRYAVGSSGERGLMQLKPAALEDVNANFALSFTWQQLFDMNVNIEVGTAYLALMYRWTGRTSWNAATQAYNAGIGNYLKNKNAGTEYLTKVLQAESAVLQNASR